MDSLSSDLGKAKVTEEQVITPWDVQGAVVDGKTVAIDYNKLVNQFGCQVLTPQLVERFERLTGRRAHHWIRRSILFSHR